MRTYAYHFRKYLNSRKKWRKEARGKKAESDSKYRKNNSLENKEKTIM